MFTIYHNPRCSTSRNALQALRDAGHEPRIVEYLVTPLDHDGLRALFAAAGIGPREALRTKEPLCQELGLDDSASDETLIDAMAQHPVLLNRPFVVSPQGAALLCRPAERVRELI